MSNLIYMVYYSEPDIDRNRLSAPAAVTKIDYIADVMKSLGYEPEIYSLSVVNDRSRLLSKYPAYVREANGIPVRFFDRYSSRFKLVRGLCRKYSEFKIRRYINRNVSREDKIVVYHSMSSLHILKALKRQAIPFALEAEEIYSDVRGSSAKRRREVSLMRMADAFILPTELMSPELNPGSKPEAIIHGIYRCEETGGS